MRQAADFGGLAAQPKIIGDILVALVHDHDGYFSVGIDERRGKQLAPAWRTGDPFRAGADKL